MQIIIGGSPSTGSSLLRQMLNRHSAIYCGPETKLFAYPQLFHDWEKYKYGLINKPFLTAPDVHLVRGSNLSGPEQKIEHEQVVNLIERSSSMTEFAQSYFKIPCTHYNKAIWAEKTPANVLTFRQFAEVFPQPLIIHIVRDPLDTIASLRSRGIPIFHAVSRYLFSTAFGLAAKGDPAYIEVRYETLVESPETALAEFFNKTGLSFEKEMLSTGNPLMTETTRMEGWTHSETDLPSKGAVGRFLKLNQATQNEIRQACECIAINERFAKDHNLDITDVRSIADHLGYSLPDVEKVDSRIRRRFARSRLVRMMTAIKERRGFVLKEGPMVVRG